MTITKQGNVGINTDNPTATLHTRGTVRFEQLPQVQQISNENVLLSDAQGNVKQTSASQLKDNLGNHTATQNLNLSAYWLSPDGSDKGVKLMSNGNVQVSDGIGRVNMGRAYSGAPYYLSSYIGFNAQRNDQGQWSFVSNGANNGGAAIVTDVARNMRFVTYKPQNGIINTNIPDGVFFKNTIIYLKTDGKVGIGTLSPRELLTVKGKLLCEEVIVVLDANLSNYPDYVFSDNYKLQSIDEIEKFIKQNKHLPEIPNVHTIKNDGMKLSELNMLLLKKIEELYLYVIELNKEINHLKLREK